MGRIYPIITKLKKCWYVLIIFVIFLFYIAAFLNVHVQSFPHFQSILIFLLLPIRSFFKILFNEILQISQGESFTARSLMFHQLLEMIIYFWNSDATLARYSNFLQFFWEWKYSQIKSQQGYFLNLCNKILWKDALCCGINKIKSSCT